jgi:protein gp37
MSDRSHIEWTDASWNPVTGCTKVSPGCAHCYAETFAERFRGVPGHPYEQGFDLRFWPSRMELPLTWKEPRRIFVNSMSDLFHEAIPESYIRQVFDIMCRADWHQFQVLTKRHERLAELAPRLPWPEHIWAGVTIENARWTLRADALRRVPSAIRFVSAEPLLGPLVGLDLAGIDWLIAGRGTGPTTRPGSPTYVTDAPTRASRSSSSNGAASTRRRVADSSKGRNGPRCRPRGSGSPRRSQTALFVRCSLRQTARGAGST